MQLDSETPYLFEALFEKDRLSQIGRLLRGLIHNINGPLQNVSMLVEMLTRWHYKLDEAAQHDRGELYSEWTASAGKQKQRFERLTQQISLLAEMLQDYMVLQEIEHNDSEVEINLILTKLSRVLRADLFFKHQVEFQLRLGENLPLVRLLGRHLVPALMHLFDNAITAIHTTAQKKLIVESLKLPGSIRILFLDSGIGPDLSKGEEGLFEIAHSEWPQSSLDEKREKHFGFGLFAVRHLLEPYGVKISIVREGEWTKVEVDIPVPC